MFTWMTFHQHVHENSSMLTICLAAQGHTFGEVEEILSRDLEKMATFSVDCVFNQALPKQSAVSFICTMPEPTKNSISYSVASKSDMNQTQFTWESPWTGPWLSAAIWKSLQRNLALEITFLASWRDFNGVHTQNISTSDLLLCSRVLCPYLVQIISHKLEWFTVEWNHADHNRNFVTDSTPMATCAESHCPSSSLSSGSNDQTVNNKKFSWCWQTRVTHLVVSQGQ